MDADAAAALVADATKKSGVIWVAARGRDTRRAQAVWHLWQDGSAYLLGGGSEQPLPDLGGGATVVVRSKDKGNRLVTWEADTARVEPGGDEWRAVVPSLLGKRLNLPDGESAPDRWARESAVWRLTPTAAVTVAGDDPDPGSQAVTPPDTPARTRLPRPLHLFGRPSRRPPLTGERR